MPSTSPQNDPPPRGPTSGSAARPQARPSHSGGSISAIAALGLALLWLLTIAVYARTIDNEFCTLDDDVLIVKNRRMVDDGSWSRLAANVAYFWRFPSSGLSRPIDQMHGMYMPCTYSLWTILLDFTRENRLDGQLGPARPELFHLASLALHLANATLVWLLLRRLVGSDWPALAGAMLFALHPAQVEAVAWISETKGVLTAFFGLAAMVVYLGPTPTQGPPSTGRYLAATALLVAALLSKPAAASIPLMLGLLEWGWYGRPWRTLLRPLGLWVAIAVAMAVLTKTQQPTSSLEFVPSLAQRPWVVLDTWAFYLRQLFWPVPLGIDYGRDPKFLFTEGRPYLDWLVPLAAVPGLFFLPGRRAWLLALGLFLVVVLPVSGLVPFSFQQYSTVADRYTYLALVGAGFALAWGLAQANRRWLDALAALALVGLAALSYRQTAPWQSNVALFEHALKVNPRSWLSEFRLATLWESRDKPELAETHYRRMFAIKPDFAVAHCNLGNLLRAEGRTDEALAEYEAAVRAMPDEWRLHLQLGLCRLDMQDRLGAIDSFQEVTRLRPERFEGFHNLGLAFLQAGQYRQAEETLARASELAPDRPDTLHYRGLALAGLGNYRKAVATLRTATRMPRASARIAGDLAWILATIEDPTLHRPAEAEPLARQACLSTDFAQPLLLDVLAVATASAGRFDDALGLADKALQLSADEPDAPWRAEIERHREAFAEGRGWSESAPRGRPWPGTQLAPAEHAAPATGS